MKTLPRLKFEDNPETFKGLFANLEQKGKTYLSNHISKFRYKKGQNLFIQNSPPSGIFIIDSGNIKISKIDCYGNEIIIRLNKIGDILGYSSLISDINITQTATAMDYVEVSFLEKSHCLTLLNDHPVIYLELINKLTSIINKTENQLCSSYQKSIRERTAELIVSLRDTHGAFQNNKWRINIRLSRAEMATMIGTTTESLIRTMTELRDSRIIEEDHKQLYITNEAQLLKWANL